MREDDPTKSATCEVSLADLASLRQWAERQEAIVTDESPDGRWSYRMKLGRETISLDWIEFRVLTLLAARPYHAFSARRIATAVSTERQTITEATLRLHIQSLRRKLGFFADYIQTVPNAGYCFKA